MKLLFSHFDKLAEAPGGVKKLRELVLQLAVQGKLVPQDPKDEPASVLLEKIQAEKERLIKEGKARNQRPLEPLKAKEIPYEIPSGWEWTKLDLYGIWKAGSTPSRNNAQYYGGPIPWVKSGEVKQGLIKTTEETITELALSKCSLDINPIGSVLIAMYGANIGEIGILEIEATTNQAVCACNSYSNIDKLFLKLLLTAWKSSFISQGAGAAQPNISRVKIVNTVVPLPPLAEQKRIVAKVDSLMTLCDDLEKQQQEKAEKKVLLNKSSLNVLSTSATKQDFHKNWNHIEKNFDLLYSTPKNIDDLKQTILQLAVMGKLVPQYPKDEPASVLLEKIQTEKEQLIEEGKIKRQKPLEPIKESEIPFEVPERWVWCRLGDILYITSGKGLTSKDMQNGNIPVYGGNGVTGYHNKYNLEKRTLVIGRVGFYCGSIHITPDRAWVTDNAFKTIFSEENIDIHFLELLLKTFDLKEKESATAQPVISGRKIYPILLPLPPLAEQKRIFAKVDSLMALCEHLSRNIENKMECSSKLLNAVLNFISIGR